LLIFCYRASDIPNVYVIFEILVIFGLKNKTAFDRSSNNICSSLGFCIILASKADGGVFGGIIRVNFAVIYGYNSSVLLCETFSLFWLPALFATFGSCSSSSAAILLPVSDKFSAFLKA
jgi:hypothetical protein